MHFQFQVGPPNATPVPDELPPPDTSEVANLLRELIAVQREQTALLRSIAASHDSMPRWRAFLARWEAEFPQVGSACKAALPHVERTYMGLIDEMAESLRPGSETFDNEFSLSEFLDRHGIRIGQMGAIVSLIGPLAEAARTEE